MKNKVLNNKIIGISISESSDIEKLGFGQMHLQDAMVEFARYLLSVGARVAYGGDVRYDPKFNFATILFDLVETYNNEYSEKTDKIINYICYPLYENLDTKIKAELKEKVDWIEINSPTDFEIKETFKETMNCQTFESRYIWSRCLSEMRARMNDDIFSRIVLGGKTTDYKGKYPGIIEETYLALKSGKPTYLLGAYGGATLAIIKALKSENVNELSEMYQFKNEDYKELYKYYNTKHPDNKIDYDAIIRFFKEIGIEGLCEINGLSKKDNILLFETDNISEMVSIVLKGLKASIK